jgi:hypothetical protein
LNLEENVKIELVDYDFFDDKELALIGRTTAEDGCELLASVLLKLKKRPASNNFFATVDYAKIDWDDVKAASCMVTAIHNKVQHSSKSSSS